MFDAVRNNKRIVQVFLVAISLPFALWGVDSYVKMAKESRRSSRAVQDKLYRNKNWMSPLNKCINRHNNA